MPRLLFIAAAALLSGCGLAEDKILHLGAGAALHPVQTIAVPDRARGTALERCAGAVVIGTAKEVVHDGAMGRGNVEVMDAVATVAGCLVIDAVIEALR